MKAQTIAIFCILFLAVAGFASATEIIQPVNDYTYYTSIIDFNITYNASESCHYEINNQSLQWFDCANNFLIDIPYQNGNVNVTIFQETDNATVSFYIDNELSEGQGFVLALLGAIPFLISLLFLFAAYGMDETHAPLKLFSYLLSMAFIIVGYNAGELLLRNYVHFPLLIEVLGSTWFNWIFYGIMSYFMLYLTYKVFMLFKIKKDPYHNG